MQVTSKIWWTNVAQLGANPYVPAFALMDVAADMSANGWMEVDTITFDTPPIADVKAFLTERIDTHQARVQDEADQNIAELEVEKQRVAALEEPVPCTPPPDADGPTDDVP